LLAKSDHSEEEESGEIIKTQLRDKLEERKEVERKTSSATQFCSIYDSNKVSNSNKWQNDKVEATKKLKGEINRRSEVAPREERIAVSIKNALQSLSIYFFQFHFFLFRLKEFQLLLRWKKRKLSF
jgi:hypothetical protein